MHITFNKNPYTLKILERNPPRLKDTWKLLSANTILFELDYQRMAIDRSNSIRQELMEKVWHPNRLKKLGYFDVIINEI